MLALLPALPLLGGLVIWGAGNRWSRSALGTVAVSLLTATGVVLGWAVTTGARSAFAWGGPLTVTLAVQGPVAAMLILVVGITALVVVYAAAHEERGGLARLVGLLISFAGAMLLLVLSADLLTLMIGFELTAVCSWGLIAHHWRDTAAGSSAAHAFNATRTGSLGLLVAAGAALAGSGSLQFESLTQLQGWPAQVFAGGILLAAVAKSAQVPFAPWLFSAMAGPTSVSALLHSATMVAAGVWTLIRLAEPLSRVGWFAPVTMIVGLFTALAGGVVAAVHPRAKHLLAASTSAQYGLMMAAVGAGYAGAAMIHLLAHAVVKALLFLTAGVALSATESDRLADHGLARLKVVAVSAWIGAMGLATIPPLGAAFSKEQIVAALGQVSTIWAVLGAVAGGLSAVYALRFAWLGFGPDHRATRDLHHPPGPVENVTVGLLAAVALGSGVLWVLPHDISSRVTGLELPEGVAWEIVLSLVLVALGAAYVALRVRASTLRRTDGPAAAADGQLADWLGLPALIRHTIVDPGLSVAAAAARFDSTVVDAGVEAAARRGLRMAATVRSVDQHVVDAGVEAAARAGQALSRVWRGVADLNVDRLVQQAAGLTTRTGTTSAAVDAGGVDGAVEQIASTVGTAGTYLRRTHTGLAQHYYAIVAAGLGVTVLLLLLLR